MNVQSNQKENLTYAQIVKTPIQAQIQPKIQTNEKSPFLGQSQGLQPVIDLNTQQVFLDLQNGQKHMMQMFLNLSQKLMNLEKHNLQMHTM